MWLEAIWILAILLLAFLWLCLTRVGAEVRLSDGTATVDVCIGRLHFRVVPAEKKKPKKKTKKKADEFAEKPEKSMPKIGLQDIQEAAAVLLPPLKRALNRTRRGIRIHPMDLRLTLGGAEDPAETAKLYGYLHAGVWTGMPVLEKLIQIPDPHIHLGMDFCTYGNNVEGSFGVTARIGTLLTAVIGVAVPALKWMVKFLKKAKKQQQSAAQVT